MLSSEVKYAMVNRFPVLYDGIEYAYIKEYVLTFDDCGKSHLSVGLMDKNLRCLVRASLERVSLA